MRRGPGVPPCVVDAGPTTENTGAAESARANSSRWRWLATLGSASNWAPAARLRSSASYAMPAPERCPGHRRRMWPLPSTSVNSVGAWPSVTARSVTKSGPPVSSSGSVKWATFATCVVTWVNVAVNSRMLSSG